MQQAIGMLDTERVRLGRASIEIGNSDRRCSRMFRFIIQRSQTSEHDLRDFGDENTRLFGTLYICHHLCTSVFDVQCCVAKVPMKITFMQSHLANTTHLTRSHIQLVHSPNYIYIYI